MPAPNQTPEQRAAEIAAMREAEARAMAELKSNPLGAPPPDTLTTEDIQLVALLAGTTNQEMKKARFGDNVMAPTAAPPIDPRRVIQELRVAAPVQPGAAAPVQPGARPQPRPPVVQQPAPQPKDPNDPQLELPFRDSNMNDVHEALERVNQRLSRIEETQKTILEFIKRVEAA
jgi:hypothetical protein